MEKNDPRLALLNKEIDDTKLILKANTDKVIERDSNLNELDHKSARLNLSSERFRIKTKKLKQNMCLKSYFPLFLSILFVFIVIMIIIISSSKNRKN
jgi:hypothetical protein